MDKPFVTFHHTYTPEKKEEEEEEEEEEKKKKIGSNLRYFVCHTTISTLHSSI